MIDFDNLNEDFVMSVVEKHGGHLAHMAHMCGSVDNYWREGCPLAFLAVEFDLENADDLRDFYPPHSFERLALLGLEAGFEGWQTGAGYFPRFRYLSNTTEPAENPDADLNNPTFKKFWKVGKSLSGYAINGGCS